MRRLFALLIASLLLASCARGPSAPPNPILSRPRNEATVPAPTWINAGATINLQTVPQIKLLGRLDDPLGPSTIFRHAFSPDGSLLAGLDNDQIVLWDLVKGEKLFNVGRREETTQIFFAADKSEFYTVETTGLVSVHQVDDGAVATTFRGSEQYEGQLAYYADDGWLAFGNRNGEVKVWDPLERKALVTIEAHDTPISQLAFSADGTLLATADDKGALAVWDWQNKQEIARFDNEEAALRLAFSPDGTLLAAGTLKDIRLWSLTDKSFAHLLDTGPQAIEVMAFSPDGKYIVNGGVTPDMMVWDPATAALAARLPGVGGDQVSMAFSPDSTLLATSVLGKQVALWNLTTITSETVNNAPLDTGDTLIFSVDWSTDSHLLTLFGAVGSVYIWGIPAA